MERVDAPELMDDLACSGEVLIQTLRELDTINKWLGGNGITLRGISKILRTITTNNPITIADLGCGSGSMLQQIAQWANQHYYNVRLTGIDANPHVVQYAHENCKDHNNINIRAMNVFSQELRQENFDIITATLFFHHFTHNELVNLFRWAKTHARIGIVVNDLHRHYVAMKAIQLLTRLFSKSPMVKNDAPLSVKRGFSKNDLIKILQDASIVNYKIRWKWAFRWQIIIHMK